VFEMLEVHTCEAWLTYCLKPCIFR